MSKLILDFTTKPEVIHQNLYTEITRSAEFVGLVDDLCESWSPPEYYGDLIDDDLSDEPIKFISFDSTRNYIYGNTIVGLDKSLIFRINEIESFKLSKLNNDLSKIKFESYKNKINLSSRTSWSPKIVNKLVDAVLNNSVNKYLIIYNKNIPFGIEIRMEEGYDPLKRYLMINISSDIDNLNSIFRSDRTLLVMCELSGCLLGMKGYYE